MAELAELEADSYTWNSEERWWGDFEGSGDD